MNKSFLLVAIVLSIGTRAQIPVELFGGHQRTTVDIMFFRYFKNTKAYNSPWLFFNRNRASIDYRMTPSTYLPQFGFTEAISYNPPSWRGFAPVAVVQVLNAGIYPKAGLQFARVKKNLTVFTWVVTETLAKPSIDWFLLTRYTPPLTERIQLFSQLELVNAFPTANTKAKNFTQRLRLGLQLKSFQFGVGSNFNQSGINTTTTFHNLGAFLRHEF